MRAGDNFCPGILNAVPAKDGLLVRIRVPGGLLQPCQLAAVAAASKSHASSYMDITSRANLQLRGISDDSLPELTTRLTAAGLLPSPAHDRVRNIVSSPLAGRDPDELFDTKSLLRLLDQQLLKDALLADLHPKFSIGLDGGGRWFSHEVDDVSLRAFRAADQIAWELFVAGSSSGLAFSTEQAVNSLLEAARTCLHACRRAAVAARGKNLVAMPDGMEKLRGALASAAVRHPTPEATHAIAEPPIGIHSGKWDGFSEIIPSIPLGRLSALQASAIASIATEHSLDLRLAPWRGIVMGSVALGARSEVLNQLRAIGLSPDDSEGFSGVVACAGIDGCEASLADVRRHAADLARRLKGRERKPGWSVHFAGCEKRCAMRTPATVKLVAGGSGYQLSATEGSLPALLSSGAAIEAIARIHATLPSEVDR